MRIAHCGISQSLLTSAATKQIPTRFQIHSLPDARKRKSSDQQFWLYAQHPRLLWAIEIQTTRVIAVVDSHGHGGNSLQIAFGQAEKFATGYCIQILHYGNRSLSEQRKPSRPR